MPHSGRTQGASRFTPWIVGTLTAALTASGCTKDPGDDTGLPGGEKPARTLTPSAEPRWTGSQLGMESGTTHAEIRGDTAIVLGTDQRGRSRLAVADADSGKVRWSVTAGDRLDAESVLDQASTHVAGGGSWQRLLVVGSGKQWSVLMAYGTPRSEEDINGEGKDPDHGPPQPEVGKTGVAALSGRDGSLRWKTELDGKPRMLDTDGRTALVSTGDGSTTSYGIDAAGKGRKLWSHPEHLVYQLAGDTALGNTSGQPGELQSPSGATLFGVDARTGKRKWNLSDTFEGSTAIGAVEGNAVAWVESEMDDGPASTTETRQTVIDTETGEEIGELDLADEQNSEVANRVVHCRSDRRTLLACATSANYLVTIRAGEHSEPVISPISAAPQGAKGTPQVDTVARGRIHLNGQFTVDSPKPPLVVNRNGDTLHRPLPGHVIADGPRHIAVLTDTTGGDRDLGGHLAIHRTTEGTAPPESGSK